MIPISERNDRIRRIQEHRALLNREEQELSRPFVTDLELIPSFFVKLSEESNPTNKDNTKMFVYIIFALYSPTSCLGKTQRVGVRKRIAKLLRVSNAAVSIQFSDAKILYDKHTGFRREVDRLYGILTSDTST